MSNNHYLFEHGSLLAIPPPPRSASRGSIRSDLGLDKPLPPLRRTSSENFARDAHHLTALPERAATPAFSVRPSRLQNRPSKISLLNLFHRSEVERGDDSEADVNPIMPPLSAVYSQAIKATIAHTSSADETLPPHIPFRSSTPTPNNIRDSRRTGGSSRLSKLHVYPRVNISAERKVFVLIPGHLLQYAERGTNDRLPERSLELIKDSIAVASDLVPGRPYTIQVAEVATVLKANGSSSSTSILARLRLRGFSVPTKTPSMLMIFDNSLELGDWLRALRREISAFGGPSSPSEASDLTELGSFGRAGTLEPESAIRRAFIDISNEGRRPRYHMTSGLDESLCSNDEILSPPMPSARPPSSHPPSVRTSSDTSPTTKSDWSSRSEHRLPLDRCSSEPVSHVHIHRKPVTSAQEARKAGQSAINDPLYNILAGPSSQLPKDSLPALSQTSPDFSVPVSRFSADSGIEISVRLKPLIQESKPQSHGQLRTSNSFSSIRSVRSIIPPTIREVPIPASPTSPAYGPRPPMRQLHSRRAPPLPANSNGKTLYRSSSQTTLQSKPAAASAGRRHSHSTSNDIPRPQKQKSVSAKSRSSVIRPATSPEPKDGTGRPPLRKLPSKLSLFPSPPTSPPTTNSPLVGLTMNEIATRSNRPVLKRPASFQVRPRPTPITTDVRSVTSSDVLPCVGLGIEIPNDEATPTNDLLHTTHARTDDALTLPRLDLDLPVFGLGPPAPPPQMPLPEIPQSRPRTPQFTRNA